MAEHEDETGYPDDEEKQLQYWKRQIDHAKAFYEPYFIIGDTLLKIYNNAAANFREKEVEQSIPDGENIARMKAGIIYAWIEQSISNLQERNPKFTVMAQNRDSVKGAKVVEATINYWHGETNQYEHDDRCLLDGFLYPWFVKKIGWNARILDEDEISMSSISDYVEDSPEGAALLLASGIPLRATEYQDHEAHIEMCVALLQDPTIPQEIKDTIIEPYMDDHKAMEEKPQADQNTTIQYDAPYGVRWHPRRFLMKPTNEHGLLDTQWIAFQWCKPLMDVKNDPMFQNTEDLKASARSVFAPSENDSPLGYDDFGEVQGYEIWVRNFPISKRKRTNLRIVIAEGHDKFLRYDDRWPFDFIEDYPAALGTFQHDVDAWINKPLLALAGADNLQMLTNEMLDSLLSVVRKEKNVFLYDKETFAETGDGVSFEAILQSGEGSAFAVEGLADMQGKPIMAVPYAQMQQDKLQLSNIMQGTLDRVLGSAEPLRSRQSDSATQAAIVDRRITAREDRRGNIFKQFQIDTARKFWQLHQQFLPERQFLIDPRADYWASVDEEIAKGEYRFHIDISSSADARAMEFDRWQKTLNILAGVTPTFMQLYNTAPNLIQVVRDLLVKGLGIQDVENYIPVDPMEMDRALQVTLQDPVQRQLIMDSLLRLKGGGDMVSGGGPGPLNPQLMNSQPQTQGEAMARAEQSV